MVRYAYASRTACLRNRIAISYHLNSKHKSLPNMVFISVYFPLYLPFYFFPFYLSKVFLPFSTPPSSLITPLSFGEGLGVRLYLSLGLGLRLFPSKPLASLFICIQTTDIESAGSHFPGMHHGLLNHIMSKVARGILATTILYRMAH